MRCFVIQPFDSGPFDKRYADTYEPAIREAGLEPYRVDQDHSVQIPINEIEDKIRNSQICLADISLDNPNVWFELGFALGCKKDVILVCPEADRSKFPFDVQHRRVICYKTESTSDFNKLRSDITESLKASLERQGQLQTISELDPKSTSDGLSPQEIAALACAMEESIVPGFGATPHKIKGDMERVGFTALAASIAIRSLLKKGYLRVGKAQDDYDQYPYTIYEITEEGEAWIISNQDILTLKNVL